MTSEVSDSNVLKEEKKDANTRWVCRLCVTVRKQKSSGESNKARFYIA